MSDFSIELFNALLLLLICDFITVLTDWITVLLSGLITMLYVIQLQFCVVIIVMVKVLTHALLKKTVGSLREASISRVG